MSETTKTKQTPSPSGFSITDVYERAAKSDRYEIDNGCDVFVPGEGNPRASFVFVGEAPGEKEVEERRPFVGPSGKLLRSSIESAGIDSEDVYITNLVKYRPNQNRTPTTAERKRFLPLLAAELTLIAPKIVYSVGKTATTALLAGTDLFRPTYMDFFDFLMADYGVWPLYHPAYILRGGRQKKWLRIAISNSLDKIGYD